MSKAKLAAAQGSGFRVSVLPMQESHRKTYWVCLDRPDRPIDAKPWDDGRMTPYVTEHVERANEDAQAWAEFLGATFVPHVPNTKSSGAKRPL